MEWENLLTFDFVHEVLSCIEQVVKNTDIMQIQEAIGIKGVEGMKDDLDPNSSKEISDVKSDVYPNPKKQKQCRKILKKWMTNHLKIMYFGF